MLAIFISQTHKLTANKLLVQIMSYETVLKRAEHKISSANKLNKNIYGKEGSDRCYE